jgi:hypothetical protein
MGGENPPSALQSAESHVAGSPGTGDPGDGSGAGFSASFAALLEWGEAEGLIRPEGEFPFLRRKPDGLGDEHEAWFHESSLRWFKATYPNEFGLAWGRDGSATSLEYLVRLRLQNQYFRDDIRLIALVAVGRQLRVLTSQPHVFGSPAENHEIVQWFLDAGFVRLDSGEGVAWYQNEFNLLVADAHRGNVIRTPDETLVPIDLNLIQPRGKLREAVLELVRASSKQ